MSEETVITNIHSLANAEKKPYLTFIKGFRLGEIIPIQIDQEYTVGRSPDCQLAVEDTAISRQHFKIFQKSKNVFLEDLRSTNGTYINGEKIQKALLQDGDTIQISQNTILKFSLLDDEQSVAEMQRYEMGVKDPVTNIFNKRYLLDRLREEFSFARRNERELSLIIFDLDHFKSINDTYGHLAGDLVLKKVAALIDKTIRSDDLFARYGGEEFVLLMRDTNLTNATRLADRLRLMVEKEEYSYDGQKIQVTLSAGVASFDSSMGDALDIIDRADHFLYKAKDAGRNQVKSA